MRLTALSQTGLPMIVITENNHMLGHFKCPIEIPYITEFAGAGIAPQLFCPFLEPRGSETIGIKADEDRGLVSALLYVLNIKSFESFLY